MLNTMSRASGASLDDPSQELEARMSRQIDVDHGDVGPQVEKGGEARRAVLRLDDLDARVRLQKRPASRDDDRMVVDNENPQKPEPSMANQARDARPAFRPSIDSSAGKINGEAGKG